MAILPDDDTLGFAQIEFTDSIQTSQLFPSRRHIHMYKSKKCLRNYYVKLSNVRSCNQNVI